MHSVLFIVVKPDPLSPVLSHLWPKTVAELRSIAAQALGTQILAENVLLIPAQHGLSALSQAIALADSVPVPYRALFFLEPPDWVSSPDRS